MLGEIQQFDIGSIIFFCVYSEVARMLQKVGMITLVRFLFNPLFPDGMYVMPY